MNILIKIISLMLFVTIAYFIYKISLEITERKSLIRSANKMWKLIEVKSDRRKSIKEQLEFEDGLQEKESFIEKVDIQIIRSGLDKRFSFINAEVYLIATGVLAFISFVGFSIFKLIYGIMAMALVILSSYLLLYMLSGINYKKIDEQILPLLNLLENYSATSDDIVTIFEKSIPYTKEPLKGYIEDFVNEVRTSGNLDRAFNSFYRKVENGKLKSLIRNLSISSNLESNYREIIQDERETIKSYIKTKEIRKSIRNTGRIEIISCYVICGFMLNMFSSFVDNMYNLLLNTMIGNGILIYCIVVTFLCVFNLVSFDRED